MSGWNEWLVGDFGTIGEIVWWLWGSPVGYVMDRKDSSNPHVYPALRSSPSLTQHPFAPVITDHPIHPRLTVPAWLLIRIRGMAEVEEAPETPLPVGTTAEPPGNTLPAAEPPGNSPQGAEPDAPDAPADTLPGSHRVQTPVRLTLTLAQCHAEQH